MFVLLVPSLLPEFLMRRELDALSLAIGLFSDQ